MLKLNDAIKLVGEFRRAPNYPVEDVDIVEIAKDLQQAAPRGFEQARSIVSRCRELSSYVPTLHDMLTVAGELNPPPEPEPEPSWTPANTRCPAGKCDGSGWIHGTTCRGYEYSRPCACRQKPQPEQPTERRKEAAGDHDRN